MKNLLLNLERTIFLFAFILCTTLSFSQVTIKSQGFESAVADNLNFTTGTYVGVSSTTSMSGTRSLRFSAASGNSNISSETLFDNIDINGYSSVQVSIAFAATAVDDNENLFIDFSYDNGSNYTTTVQLIDGDNGSGGQNLSFGTGDSSPGQSTNPYVFNVPSTSSSLKIRVRSTSLDGSEFFYIDNIVVRGIEKTEINLRGGSPLTNITNGSTTISTTINTDFGTITQNSGLVTKTYTVQNLGLLNLTIASVSTNNTEYTASISSSTITPGGTATLTVEYNPLTIGTISATVSISNNDSDESTYTFNVEAVCVNREINVTGNSNNITDGSTSISTSNWTDFGSMEITSGTVTRTYTIQNTGTTSLTISNPTISGTHAADFSVTTNPSTLTIAGGSSTTFVVTFNPSATGTRSATISITNNDLNENPYDFAIQGTGITPEINVQGNSTTIADGSITISTTDHTDFGSVDIAGVTFTRTYTIQNTGTNTLTISNPTLSGTNAADFTIITNPSTLSIAAGASTTFVVSFNPSATGPRNAAISITNNDSDENPYDFSIQGTGIIVLTSGPGGITADLQLWLRADLINGTTNVSDNTAVNTWNTQALGTDAVRPTNIGAPVYRNNASYNLNFNAVVDFTNNYNTAPQVYTDDDGTRQYLKGTEGFYSNDMFVVLMPDVNVTSSLASMDIFCGDQIAGTPETDASGIGYGNYTARFTNEVLAYGLGTSGKYGAGHISTSASYDSVGIINAFNNAGNTGMQLNFNANNVVNSEVNTSTYGNVANSQYWIGRSEGWDGSLDGRIAEIITFSSRKNDATERTKIETYLAVKYGITLGVNGTSKDYIASNGTTIWNTTANAGFNYNIAGIGRDDISKLNQKQSKSANANTVLTIGLTTIAATNTANTNTFDTDVKYLVWGDNGGNMSDSGSDLSVTFGASTVTTLTDLPNKKWKVVETGGDVATVKVAVATADLVSLPALGTNDAYVMVVATNSTFTTGVETVFLTTEGANQVANYDFDGTKFITFGVAHETVLPRHISLDGSDDNVKIDVVNDLPGTFSMMVWVRPDGQNGATSDRTIVSKYNGTTGYRMYLGTDNKVYVSWIGGTTLTSSIALPNAIWHNLAVIYSSGSIKLYIDGVLDTTVTSAAPANSSNMFSIGGEYRSKTDIRNLFKGDIDELRLFSSALTPAEIRFIMNQEILQNTTGIKGTVLPTTITKNDISSLTWSSLFAYYTMNSYIGTHLNDDSTNNNRGSLVIPDKITIAVQTAPMPYQTTTNGLWSNTATWTNGTSQDLPNSLSIVDGTTRVDWNIVNTSHNVSSTGNKTLLGLTVNSNTLSADNNTKIEVSHYLKLDGKIDLAGKSQLVQTNNSDLDVTSSGSIERDQQGQSNTYNYNYWSSPVSTINNTTINHGYTVAGVMKDGTTSTPQNLNWSAGLNGAATSPATIASYWIFKFQNYTNSYANWSAVGPNGALLAGQGYTMKGSNAVAANQNYTFVGKPNNGTITSSVSAGNLNLCGNPFASAIDADQFIDDNTASITGTLYFWEHFDTNTSHNTIDYQGGYATYTKVGGTAPVAPAGVSGLGSSSKTAKRFIPVGQGFFVTGSAAGGTITFNNSQRIFVKEDNTNSYTLYRNNANATVNSDPNYNNSEDTFGEEEFMKLRLGYTSANNYHREILLGFMNENATSGFDQGYDALSIETLTNDMYYINTDKKLNIQGEGVFNANNTYPIGVKNATEGNVKFILNGIENFEESQDIFIYDNETQIYHDIKSQDFEISLPVGTFDTRFSLRFLNPSALGTNENELQHGVAVTHSQSDNMVNINNELQEVTIKSVALYNLLGQQVISWKIDNQNQTEMHLPVSGVSAGGYIVKIKTDKGDITKKILIK